MDEDETIARDTEQLEDLDKEIQEARQHLEDITLKDQPEFYQDDESSSESAPGKPDVGPGDLPG